MNRSSALSLFVLVAAGCASTPPVNMDAARRVVGTESAVRIDAEIRGDELRAGVSLPITYEITNNRDRTIAVADIIPVTNYDHESNTVTVSIGSEVPGESLLPRLIAIPPGEKKTFTTAARIAGLIPPGTANPERRVAMQLRLKVNFLGDTTGFDDLIDIPEKAVADPKRADEVFPVWLERNEAVYTNTIPMRWLGRAQGDATSTNPARTGPVRRGRRG